MYNKKGITVAVAISLLILVGVVAYFSLQSWFLNYKGSFEKLVEGEGFDSKTEIIKLTNSSITIKNTFKENLELTSLKINGSECNLNSSEINKGTIVIPFSGCEILSSQLVALEVVILTPYGVMQEFELLRDSIYNPNIGGSFVGYVYGENVGYISFNGTEYGVALDNNQFNGYAYGENVGYISFNDVNLSGINLVGYAYGENIGYISFNGTNYNVTFNDTHLIGYAYGENIGYINFNNSPTYSVYLG